MGIVVLLVDEFPPDVGGVGHSAARIAHGMVSRGLEVRVVVLESSQGEEPLVVTDHHGIPVLRFARVPTGSERSQSWDAERAVRVLEQLRREAVDVVHAFFPTTTGMVAGLLANATKAPLLASFRGNDLYEAMFGRQLGNLRWILRHADLVTFVNQEMADMARVVEPDAPPGEVIWNGVAPALPVPLRVALVPPVVIGTSGVMRSKKGMRVLLRAAARLRHCLDFRLVMVGCLAPKEASHWQTEIRTLDLQELVEVTGLLPHQEVASRLARLDIYLHPAIYDGCPNSLLEAAAAGLPIVCARSGASRDLLVGGRDCLLHDCDDDAGLASAVCELASSPALRRRLGEAARQRMIEACSLEQEQQTWQRIYERARMRRRSRHGVA